MTAPASQDAPSRPLGQLAIMVVLLANAGVCLFFAVILQVAERTGSLRFYVPIAVLTALGPTLAFASIASPILTWRRSALGLILAGAIAFGLFIDSLFCFLSLSNFVLLLLKFGADVAFAVILGVCLVIRGTYAHLNPQSYGFPVVARAIGNVQPVRVSAPSPDASSDPGGPSVSIGPAPQVFPHDAQIAAHIKEAHMQSYIRTANYLRVIALIVRIVSLLVLFANFLLVAYQLYGASAMFGRYSFSSPELMYRVTTVLFSGLSTGAILLLLFVATYIVTALAELLRCQATKAG